MAAAFALIAAALFAAALITTQFGLRHMDGLAGAKISIPSAAALLWALFPLCREGGFDGWHAQGAGIFIALGLFFPVAVTLLAYEANRRMGPTIAGAIGSTAPLFAVLGAVLFLREAMGLSQMAATLAIVAGSTVLVWRGNATGDVLKGAAFVSWVAWLAALLRALAQVIAKAGLLLWPDPYVATLLGYSVSAVAIWGVSVFSRRAASRVYTRRGTRVVCRAGSRLGKRCVADRGGISAVYTAAERRHPARRALERAPNGWGYVVCGGCGGAFGGIKFF